MRPYRENRYLQVLGNTVGQNVYLRLFAFCKFFFRLHINIDKGDNVLPKHFERTLNLVALLKLNKHKMRSLDFSTAWPNLVLEYFFDSRRIYRLFHSIFANPFFAMRLYRYQIPKRVIQCAFKLPSISHT